MTHDVERVFADIDADHGDRCVEFLRHGVLLVLSATCQLLMLAGPEHGRTIPLAVAADIASCRSFDPEIRVAHHLAPLFYLQFDTRRELLGCIAYSLEAEYGQALFDVRPCHAL